MSDVLTPTSDGDPVFSNILLTFRCRCKKVSSWISWMNTCFDSKDLHTDN